MKIHSDISGDQLHGAASFFRTKLSPILPRNVPFWCNWEVSHHPYSNPLLIPVLSHTNSFQALKHISFDALKLKRMVMSESFIFIFHYSKLFLNAVRCFFFFPRKYRGWRKYNELQTLLCLQFSVFLFWMSLQSVKPVYITRLHFVHGLYWSLVIFSFLIKARIYSTLF